ncbi:13293_t:CDS:2, partial [Funneliformis geosporum]
LIRSSVTVTTFEFPKLGFNKLQERFHIRDEKISVINRKYHEQIWNAFRQAVDKVNASRGLYIHGPSGLGKSYSLYYVVSQLRLKSDECRVTYINSCDVWWNTHQTEPYEYLLKELICTFNKDELPTKSIVEWVEFVMKSRVPDRKELFLLFLKELTTFVISKDLYWIWIFDQHNALYKYNALYKFPFVIVKSLGPTLQDNGLIIISASANNEVFPKEFNSWKQLNLYGGYCDEEFNEWCKLYNYYIDGDPEVKSQLDAIKFWTGAYPLELDMWHQTPGDNLSEKTQNYLEIRIKAIELNHQTYRESLSIERKLSLSQCVYSMILQITPPQITYGMDRQLMYIDTASVWEGQNKDKEVKVKTIIAIHPLAKLAIIYGHNKEIINGIQMVASTVLQSSAYTNDAKGRVAELYIITEMAIKRLFEFKCRNFSRTKSVKFDQKVQFDNVIRFTNNDVPIHLNNFNIDQTTFFIPESPTYPFVDCLLWDSHDEILFAFQITVSKLEKHADSAKNFLTRNNNSTLKKWATLCDINESNIFFIWIAPDDVVEGCISK